MLPFLSPDYWNEHHTGQGHFSARTLREIELSIVQMLERLKPGPAGVARMQQKIRLSIANAAVESGHTPSAHDMAVHPASNAIDKALDRANAAYSRQLVNLGLSSATAELLRSWVELTVDARVLQHQIEIERALSRLGSEVVAAPAVEAPADDASQLLPAAQMGRALGGVSDETVRQRENAGELFSILPVGRKRGRGYPAFQAWPDIAGAPLKKVLSALGGVSATATYGFFTSPTDLLGGLTPIESMLGRLTVSRSLPQEGQNVLQATSNDRLIAVVKAATVYASAQAA